MRRSDAGIIKQPLSILRAERHCGGTSRADRSMGMERNPLFEGTKEGGRGKGSSVMCVIIASIEIRFQIS